MNPDDPAAVASPIEAPWPLELETEAEDAVYVFTLFIAGMSPRSRRAVANLTALCERHLAGRYELQIVDIYQQPDLAKGEQLVAAPTLIRRFPLPLRRFIGDLSDTEGFLLRM